MIRYLFVLFLFLYSCQDLDILIKNGLIIDGTGEKGFLADIGIKKSKIMTIKKDHKTRAKLTIVSKKVISLMIKT